MKRISVVRVELVKERNLTVDFNHVTGPGVAYEIAKKFIGNADREHFITLLLNTKNCIAAVNTVSVGNLNSTIVHPREVFKPAILASANALILAHNHPSGDPTPSSEDIGVTKRLVEAGKLLGIPVLDHIVVGENTYCSLTERGII